MFRLSLKYSLSALVIAISLMIPSFSPVHAESSWLDKAQEGGLDTIGSDAYDQSGEPNKSLEAIITGIIRFFLGFMGLIFLVMIIVSGFQYMTAGGNEETVKLAVTRLRNAVIGLIIVLSAFSITYFITNTVVRTITNSN